MCFRIYSELNTYLRVNLYGDLILAKIRMCVGIGIHNFTDKYNTWEVIEHDRNNWVDRQTIKEQEKADKSNVIRC